MVALVTAVGFFWLATRVDVYQTTSPRELSHTILGSAFPDVPHPWWLSLHIWVRKVYSIVAFAIVGYTADRALPPVRRPRLRAAAIVAIYSACIELAQISVSPNEPVAERYLDVGCGAAGGWIGIIVGQAVTHRQIRKDDRTSTGSS